MPKKVDHTSQRKVFLTAAKRTVEKKGVSGATARAVAKEAGFTTGALVHYVDSMQSLLVEASEDLAQDVYRDLTVLEKLPDKLEALRQVLYLALPLNTERQGNWKFLIGLWERASTDPKIQKHMVSRAARWHKRTEQLILGARKAGDIPADIDARGAAIAIAAMIDGLSLYVVRTGKPLPAREQCALIDQWIISWLRPVRALAKDHIQ